MTDAIAALARQQDVILENLKKAADYISQLEYVRGQLIINSHGIVITLRPCKVSIWSHERLVTWENVRNSTLLPEINQAYKETMDHIQTRNIR